VKVQKKPVVVEAEQFFPEKKPWPEGIEDWGCAAKGHKFMINTLNGEVVVYPGEWVITGVGGEHYPCKADIFEQTYERVKQ